MGTASLPWKVTDLVLRLVKLGSRSNSRGCLTYPCSTFPWLMDCSLAKGSPVHQQAKKRRLSTYIHTHEINDFLRRVDDPHRVGQLDRVPSEAPLADRVQEVLLVGPVGHRAGRVLD